MLSKVKTFVAAAGFSTCAQIEVPPLGLQRLEAPGFHNTPQQNTVLSAFLGNFTPGNEFFFTMNVSLGPEMVNLGAHWQFAAKGIDNGYVDGQSIIVQTSAT